MGSDLDGEPVVVMGRDGEEEGNNEGDTAEGIEGDVDEDGGV